MFYIEFINLIPFVIRCFNHQRFANQRRNLNRIIRIKPFSGNFSLNSGCKISFKTRSSSFKSPEERCGGSAAFLGFFRGSAASALYFLNTERRIMHSPFTSAVPSKGMRDGTERIVITCAVTSSPTTPLPRVAAPENKPFS